MMGTILYPDFRIGLTMIIIGVGCLTYFVIEAYREYKKSLREMREMEDDSLKAE